jgi:hypothetical protein
VYDDVPYPQFLVNPHYFVRMFPFVCTAKRRMNDDAEMVVSSLGKRD